MRQKWFRELLRRRIFIIIMLVIQGAALILFITSHTTWSFPIDFYQKYAF